MELGPNAPVGNHDVRHDAFSSLQDGDCAHVADVGQYADGQARQLYQGVGNACLAAFSDRIDLWEEAEAAFGSFQPASFDFTCYDRAAYQVFTALVESHRRDPTRAFERASSGNVAVKDSCVRMSDVQPNSGPLEGGYEVTITGQNFPDPTTVMVGYSSEINVTVAPEAGGTRVTFTMPAVENPGEVYLVVMNEGADTALPFEFERAASASSTDPTNPSVDPETPSARDEPSETPSRTDEPSETPSRTDEPTETPSATDEPS